MAVYIYIYIFLIRVYLHSSLHKQSAVDLGWVMWVFREQVGRGQAHSEMQRLQHYARGLNRNSLETTGFQAGLAGFQSL